MSIDLLADVDAQIARGRQEADAQVARARRERLDRFAAAALTGLLAAGGEGTADWAAVRAWDCAEAMETERARRMERKP